MMAGELVVNLGQVRVGGAGQTLLPDNLGELVEDGARLGELVAAGERMQQLRDTPA